MTHRFARSLFRSRPHRLAAALALAGASLAANAASFTLSGNITRDDQITFLNLVLDTAGTVLVTSLGYAGGIDTLGQMQARGGFDSMLFLYNSSGTLVAQSDDGVGVPADPTTGLAADAAFSIALAAGSYTLALTQYDNFALGNLSAGFSQAGAGNFTPSMSPTCTATSFCDWSGASRNGHWVLAITGVSAVPEPSGLGLMLAGLAGAAWLRRRHLLAA